MKPISTQSKKILLLFAVILWFCVAAIWIAMIVIDAVFGYTPEGPTILRVFCVLASLVAAILNLLRYRAMREGERCS